MNVTQAMNTVFIQNAIAAAGEFFRSASLQKHNNYRLKVLERCLNTQDLPLIFDFAETEFSSAPKSKHDKFRAKVNALWTEFSKPEVQAAVFQAVQPLVQPRLENMTVVIGGEVITAEQAKTFSNTKLKNLARIYNREHPEDALGHLGKSPDRNVIIRHIWRV